MTTSFRFYFASQVSSTGGPVRSPDPASHAKVFYDLVVQEEQGNWNVQFTKGGEAFPKVSGQQI